MMKDDEKNRKIKVDEKYIQQLAETETVFDMAAVCYRILEDEIANPVTFISGYVDESREGEDIAFMGAAIENALLLRNFADDVGKLLEQYSVFDFPRRRDYIAGRMRKLSLAKFGNDKENQLAVVFTLLSTIDSLVPSWGREVILEREALNQGSSRESYPVYMAVTQTLHYNLICEIGRGRKYVGDFGETLHNLIFISQQNLPRGADAPEICFLPHERREGSYQTKIAIITGVCGSHFEFKYTVGSTQIVEYIEAAQEQVAHKLCDKMYIAIRQGAQFIVLPEFCISSEILAYIEGKLREWKKDKELQAVSKLIAVFPGSTWTASNDNVQYILDSYGREIGQYYKNTPYRKEKKHAGEIEGCEKAKNDTEKISRGDRLTKYESCEGIEHPGLRTSLLWVEGIGYVQPATCRDVIDGRYTEFLVQRFNPTFVMVPAWSSSGSSFEDSLKRYARDYCTNSILCNGCGALKGAARIVGGVSVLDKEGTRQIGTFQPVKKPQSNDKECMKECGKYCSHLVEVNLDSEMLGKEDRVVVTQI